MTNPTTPRPGDHVEITAVQSYEATWDDALDRLIGLTGVLIAVNDSHLRENERAGTLDCAPFEVRIDRDAGIDAGEVVFAAGVRLVDAGMQEPAPSMSVAEAEAALAPLEAAVRAGREAQPTETDEQRADREETARDHARGDHTYCGITCEVELPTEHLRNFVIAKGYPGTRGALDELLRRAAASAAPTAAETGDRAALRDRIADAARTVRLRLGPTALAMAQRGEPIILSGGEADDVADAVLPVVLSEPTDQAAVRAAALREAIALLDQRASGIAALSSSDFGEEARAVRELAGVAAELRRRLADEAQGTTCPGFETVPNRCGCPCEGCKHNCAAHEPAGPAAPAKDTPDGCTCAVAGDAFAPAGHYADCPAASAKEAQHEVVHGCPPDGSGLTPCCGRTPFELPRTDRISSEAPITCTGNAPAKEA